MTTEPAAAEGGKPRGNPPVNEIPDGLLRAAIWQHEGDYGPRYSITFRRRYKDENGDWNDSYSFGPDDLLPLGELRATPAPGSSSGAAPTARPAGKMKPRWPRPEHGRPGRAQPAA